MRSFFLAAQLIISGGGVHEADTEQGLYYLRAQIPFHQSSDLRETMEKYGLDPNGASHITPYPDHIAIDLPPEALKKYAAAFSEPPTRIAFEQARVSLESRMETVYDTPCSFEHLTFSQIRQCIQPQLLQISPPPLTDQQVLIDGKILMLKPQFIHTQTFGWALGGLCLLTTIGFIIAGFLVSPLLVLGGIPALFSTVYFVGGSYLQDPKAIAHYRKDDLASGFRIPYRKKTAGYTLTPRERRIRFIHECITPSNYAPILWLADIYQLNDPLIIAMWHPEELQTLIALKESFIRARTDLSSYKAKLQEELFMMLAHHQEERDLQLDQARAQYERNYAIRKQRQIKNALETSLYEIEKEYQEGKITYEEKEQRIEETRGYFSGLLDDPELQQGVFDATQELISAQQQILSAYEEKVLACKQILSFDEKMQWIEFGSRELSKEHSAILIKYLQTLLADDPAIEDFLDLTKS